MGKEAITVTIDRHLHQWIKEKGGNKSRVVNQLLHECWNKQRDKPRESPLHLRKRSFDEHMKQLDEVLDEMGELQ
jgi:glycogen synthase